MQRCFVNVIGALDHDALNENQNAVFILSSELCFIFVVPINVIFMRSLYEADIQCDCIINIIILQLKHQSPVC